MERLLWAREHLKWNVKQWEKVLWSDESKFQLFGSNRRKFVERMSGERAAESFVVPMLKHKEGLVLLWGCFREGKSGDLVKIKGILEKKQYHFILQRRAKASGTRIIGKKFILQQDNNPNTRQSIAKIISSQKKCKVYIGLWNGLHSRLICHPLSWHGMNQTEK